MDCTDLFFEVQAKDRTKPSSTHPSRNHYLRRGYAIASSNGFITFSSSLPFGIATKVMDGQPQEEIVGEINPLLHFPNFMQNSAVQLTHQQQEMSRQVLSLLSLIDKALNFRFLKCIYPQNMEAQVDRAWIICCYLACLLHDPMGLFWNCLWNITIYSNRQCFAWVQFYNFALKDFYSSLFGTVLQKDDPNRSLFSVQWTILFFHWSAYDQKKINLKDRLTFCNKLTCYCSSVPALPQSPAVTAGGGILSLHPLSQFKYSTAVQGSTHLPAPFVHRALRWMKCTYCLPPPQGVCSS